MNQIERIFLELSRIKGLEGKEREEAISILEEKKIEKRLKWLEKNYPDLGSDEPIRQAYNIFYLDYLGLEEKDGKIIELSDTKLVTHWRNDCPVLRAGLSLGLETREICQKIYERPCQELLRKINPNLIFKRDYSKIRPYADFCEEVIELKE